MLVRFRQFLLALVTGSGALLYSAVPADASIFNAVTDFSIVQNPAGTWAYGYGSAPLTFTSMQQSVIGGYYADPNLQYWREDPNSTLPPYVMKNVGPGAVIIDGSAVIPTGVLNLHPGPSQDTIVQWTAPHSGVYSYSGLFELLDAFPTGIIAQIFKYSTVAATTSTLFSTSLVGPGANLSLLTPGSSVNFGGSLFMDSGDKLSFVVKNKGNFAFDSTGLKVQIEDVPEPASVAVVFLAALTLFLFGAVRRSGLS